MMLSDIHCHILPKLDDGAKSIEQSVAMIRMAYDQGFRMFVATSHFSPLFPQYTKQQAEEKRIQLLERVNKEISPEIKIVLGQEILYSEEALKLLKQGELIPIASSRYVLVEFYPHESYRTIQRAVREIITSGYIPILAHIERYEALEKLESVEGLIQSGAKIQINYNSISGKLFDQRSAYCRKLLSNEMVHFLGTDMHDTEYRKPSTAIAMKWMTKHLDRTYLDDISNNNAQRICNGERI